MKQRIKEILFFLTMTALVVMALSPNAQATFYKTMWKVKNYLTVGTSTHYTSRVSVNTKAVGTKGVVVRGVASQTANLIEAQNSSGTNIFSVGPGGGLKMYQATSDPCATLATSTIFFNANTGNGYPCFCDGSSADLVMDGSSACF